MMTCVTDDDYEDGIQLFDQFFAKRLSGLDAFLL